jgi:hypothetical protein
MIGKHGASSTEAGRCLEEENAGLLLPLAAAQELALRQRALQLVCRLRIGLRVCRSPQWLISPDHAANGEELDFLLCFAACHGRIVIVEVRLDLRQDPSRHGEFER